MSRHVLNLDGDQVHALVHLLGVIDSMQLALAAARNGPMKQLRGKLRKLNEQAIAQLNARTHPPRRDRRLQPKECRENHNQACHTCPDDVCGDNTTEPELRAKLAAEVLATRQPMSADEQTATFAATGLAARDVVPTAKGLAVYGNAKRERVAELEACARSVVITGYDMDGSYTTVGTVPLRRLADAVGMELSPDTPVERDAADPPGAERSRCASMRVYSDDETSMELCIVIRAANSRSKRVMIGRGVSIKPGDMFLATETGVERYRPPTTVEPSDG